MTSVISAVFDSENDAHRAVEDLRAAGASDDGISLIGRHGEHDVSSDDGDSNDGNVARGLIGGGALGAGLGVAALAIPGVGPLAAAGAIAASAIPSALGIGAAAGAAAGTLKEMFQKHGVSDEDASYYDQRVSSGGTFVSVDPNRSGIDADEAREILRRSGGHSASSANQSQMAGQTDATF